MPDHRFQLFEMHGHFASDIITACKVCGNPRLNDSVSLSVGPSIEQLTERSHQGCVTCSVLLQGITTFVASKGGALPGDLLSTPGRLARIDYDLSVSTDRGLEIEVLRYDAEKASTEPIKMSFYCSERTPWLSKTLPSIPVGNEVPPSTASEESLDWAVEHVKICMNTHPSCGSPAGKHLPTRVLDVEATCESGVSLYISHGRAAPYVCLSHCWGRRLFLRTVSSNLDAHIKSIPFAALPPTFQEAIDFTRRLGIRYLWIDSLCIVQDDENDWRVEASRMASIYQNCYLVLSAAKSSGAYEGLYTDFPQQCRTSIISFDARDPDDGSISRESIRIRQPLTHSQRPLLVSTSPGEPLPVFTRGWIFQERLLGPRVLHFGPEELSWECREASDCQCAGHPANLTPQKTAATAPSPAEHVPFGITTQKSLQKSYYSPIAWDSVRSGDRDAHLETVWHRLVEDYTRLDLTYEKDVFPALSGFAALVQKATGWGYLAGLWRETLPRALLWNVERPSALSSETTRSWPRRPRGGWRAPSWSWAAVDCPVKFEAHEIDRPDKVEALCRIVEARSGPAGPDPRGELAAGESYLVVRGRVVPANMRFREGMEELLPTNIAELDVFDGYMSNFWVDDDRGVSDSHSRLENRDVVCLLASRHTDTDALNFLVLELAREMKSTKGALPNTVAGAAYRRVGVASVLDGPVGAPLHGWVNELLELGSEAVVAII